MKKPRGFRWWWGLAGVVVAACVAALPPAHAQNATGTIRGTIQNAETRGPLPFAGVVIFKVTKEDPVGSYAANGQSDDRGAYTVAVEPGTYKIIVSYIGYEVFEQSGLKVVSGAPVTKDVLLTPAAIQTETVRVTGEVVRTAEGSMITKLRKDAGVSNAITADQIRKSSDSDAAEAVQRVSGVSVVGGRYVYVRGLGERYTSTQVNGAGVGTPEPNKKVVPLNIFPTAVLDNLIVNKTYTADMDGEFGGSVINLNTKDYLDHFTVQQTLSMGYTAAAEDFIDYQDGQFDFLGVDDGSRAFPSEVEDYAGGKRIDNHNFTAGELGTMGQEFLNEWTPHKEGPGPNWAYSGLVSDKLPLFGKDSGYLVSAALSNTYDSIQKEDNSYRGSGVVLSPNILSDVREANQSVLGGATGNFTWRPGENSNIKLNLLYTRQAEDKSRVAEAENNDRGSNMRVTQLAYVQRGLFSSVLQGNLPTALLGSSLHWNVGYSQAMSDEPDRRTSVYEDLNGTGVYSLGGGSVYPLTRIFGHSTDYDRSYKFDWTVPFTSWTEQAGSLKTGYANHDKTRYSEYRRFGFTCRHRTPCSGVDLSLPPEGIVSAPNLEQGLFRFEEATQTNDSYRAFHDINALYTSLDVPILPAVRAVVGVRYEDSEQRVESQSNFATTQDPTFVSHDDDEVLPTVNLTLLPHRNMNVRLAYAKTVNRPELRELSPFSMFNFETGYSETGDTNLVTAKIRNYDLRWELYPSPGEFAALGVFYKDFQDPIQKFVNETTGGYALKPQNGEEASLYGWEAEMRISMITMWKALDWMMALGAPPAALLPWSLVANYSRVTSEVTILDNVDVAGNPIYLEKPFTGQSKYATNLGVFYGARRWEGSLLYKAFGNRVDAYGTGSLPDIYEFPGESLDLTLGYKMNNTTRLKLTAENLLDEETLFKQGNEVTQKWNTGTRVGIAVSIEP